MKREFSQDTRHGVVAGNTFLSFSSPQGKKLFELHQVQFGPSFDFGEGGAVGKESEKDDGENGLKGLRHALFGAGIRNFLETLDEDFEGGGSRHRGPP